MLALPRATQRPLRTLSLLSTTLLAALALAAPAALAAAPTALGDFDGDGVSDLAVGVPADSVSGQPQAGAVNVVYGAGGGLTEVGDQQFTKAPQQIAGAPQPNARFGAALAGGDLSRNGRDELAIGIPGGLIGGDAEAAAVSVLYGRSGGLTSVDDLWSQDARGIKGIAEPSDRFGAALAIGDFDGDRAGDLAIGVPDDSVGNAAGAGAVNGSTARTPACARRAISCGPRIRSAS